MAWLDGMRASGCAGRAEHRGKRGGSDRRRILPVRSWASWAALSVALIAPQALAEDAPWTQYDKTIAKKRDVASLTNDLFGDSVDLYNGRLSFHAVDIDLPGNNGLPVRLARSFNVVTRLEYSTQNPFANWELDVPSISGVYASKFAEIIYETNYTWDGQRCSGALTPPTIGPYFAMDYWYGLSANMPGGGELLTPNPVTRKPADGTNYRWVTTGFTWFSCLPSIKNTSGEGFLAIGKDGTRYWFDWLAVYDVWPMLENYDVGYAQNLFRKRNVLYATRVEDRFGNWVTYSYSNASTAPARLNRIESSDGRYINLTYNAAGQVASATDGLRTWQYSYTGNALGAVTLPDASQWKFDYGDIFDVYAGYAQEPSCDFPGYWFMDMPPVRSMSMTHPSGAVGQFFVDGRLHGRSNVWRNCAGPIEATYSDFVRMYWTPSLVRKRISGAGMSPVEWNYQYVNADVLGANNDPATHSPPGSWATGTAGKPFGEPTCVSDSCAGSTVTEVTSNTGEWLRYTYGNSYRYNEHKLLKLERGAGPNAIMRTEQYAYELATTGQPFPTPVGVSTQYKGDSYTDTFLRPLKSTTVTQDGVVYRTVVNAFDAFGRPLSTTRSSTP